MFPSCGVINTLSKRTLPLSAQQTQDVDSMLFYLFSRQNDYREWNNCLNIH